MTLKGLPKPFITFTKVAHCYGSQCIDLSSVGQETMNFLIIAHVIAR